MIELALSVLKACAAAGVKELVVCAGARNAPFVSALAKADGVKTYSFFEERSAAFFALGRILATGLPVAVITTSGTAAAELLPAVIEADYQGLPLILITADRPRRYRGSGAPQTIIQPGLFSGYVDKSWDIEGAFDERLVLRSRPVHLNVCFDEPLLDRPVEVWEWPAADESSDELVACESPVISALNVSAPNILVRRPLVIVGGVRAQDVNRVHEIVRAWRRPVYAEATSQLRGAFEHAVLEKDLANLDYDSVIRIGSVPTLRLWRDLEHKNIPVWHFSHLPYSGLPGSAPVHPMAALGHFDFEPAKILESGARLQSCLERFPLSEPAWINWLSRLVPSDARLFLGNSLPIREWDLAADSNARPEVFANRGVNGIDGLISTFIGVSSEVKSNWCIIGDLTALYDLSGPWALRERPELCALNIVIINNGGGKIFERMFRNPLFENRHDLGFADWARMWKLDYVRIATIEKAHDIRPQTSRPRVIEIVPSLEQTAAFWQAWESV